MFGKEPTVETTHGGLECGILFGKKNDLEYYYDRPRIIGDYHGQAPMLWCTYALLCK